MSRSVPGGADILVRIPPPRTAAPLPRNIREGLLLCPPCPSPGDLCRNPPFGERGSGPDKPRVFASQDPSPIGRATGSLPSRGHAQGTEEPRVPGTGRGLDLWPAGVPRRPGSHTDKGRHSIQFGEFDNFQELLMTFTFIIENAAQ